MDIAKDMRLMFWALLPPTSPEANKIHDAVGNALWGIRTTIKRELRAEKR